MARKERSVFTSGTPTVVPDCSIGNSGVSSVPSQKLRCIPIFVALIIDTIIAIAPNQLGLVLVDEIVELGHDLFFDKSPGIIIIRRILYIERVEPFF